MGHKFHVQLKQNSHTFFVIFYISSNPLGMRPVWALYWCCITPTSGGSRGPREAMASNIKKCQIFPNGPPIALAQKFRKYFEKIVPHNPKNHP